MGDRRNDDAQDESWTEIEAVPSDAVEILPIRHGMVLAGRYAIEQIIGRGGSGVVVRAHDRDLRAAVAIKIVRAELAGQRVWAERLAREVRLARQIHHPHVCRVFDFEQADGRAFLVMELADRGTLRDEIRSGALAARPIAERIADARTVAWALDAIHRAGIVHRDLSPQNLLRMGDGRLVLSDFGLAVDVADSTSSVHGGTVAYMAPEIMRGGSATFASDIWALGVVIHELVFGAKPRWSEGMAGRMLPPELGRPLTREESAVLETCRACTTPDPAHRIARAANVAVLLVAPRRWPRLRRAGRLVASRRPALLAGALTVVAALAIGGWRARHGAPAAPDRAAEAGPLIVPTGEAADWTDVSTVLAEVPERIVCTRPLPDQRTLRFVWGTPPRAEDIDTVTRRRIPSPLVPAAYAEGCPDLSPDGKRLIYQGHTPDGRASAFLSERPDGKDAVPVVQTAEPSMNSEPTWLADGQAFSYDVDLNHAGVFETVAGRVNVLPEPGIRPVATVFRHAIGKRVFVESVSPEGASEFVGIEIPSFKSEVRFGVADPALDLLSAGRHFYYVSWVNGMRRGLVEVDLALRTARRIGTIRDRTIRYPAFVAEGLTFAALGVNAEVAAREPNGNWVVLTKLGQIRSVARCGRDLIVAADTNDGRILLKRLDGSGRTIGVLTSGPMDVLGACTADGKEWFYTEFAPQPQVKHCDDHGCRTILSQAAFGLDLSPDGSRLVFANLDGRGVTVGWIGRDGGKPHEIAQTDSTCAPGWASNQTVWLSQRRHGKAVWIELDADSGRETGRMVAASHDCTDGTPDPDSPVGGDVRVVRDQTSQIRLLEKKLLGPN